MLFLFCLMLFFETCVALQICLCTQRHSHTCLHRLIQSSLLTSSLPKKCRRHPCWKMSASLFGFGHLQLPRPLDSGKQVPPAWIWGLPSSLLGKTSHGLPTSSVKHCDLLQKETFFLASHMILLMCREKRKTSFSLALLPRFVTQTSSDIKKCWALRGAAKRWDCSWLTGKQLCSKRPWGPGGQEADHESAFVAMKAVCILGYIATGCVQFWAPRIRKILSNWSKSSWEICLGGLCGMRRETEESGFILPGEANCCLQLLKWSYRHGRAWLFLKFCSARSERQWALAAAREIPLYLGKMFFNMRVVKHWEVLPG